MENLSPEQQEQLKLYSAQLDESFENLRSILKQKLTEQVDVIIDVYINGFKKGFEQVKAQEAAAIKPAAPAGEQGNSFVNENLNANDDLGIAGKS